MFTPPKQTPEELHLVRTKQMASAYQHALTEVTVHYGDLVRSLHGVLTLREHVHPWEDWANHPLPDHVEPELAGLEKLLEELDGDGSYPTKWEEALMVLSDLFRVAENKAHAALNS